MVQSGHWPKGQALDETEWRTLMDRAIDTLNLDQARVDVLPFVQDPDALALWSRPFFHDVARRIIIV